MFSEHCQETEMIQCLHLLSSRLKTTIVYLHVDLVEIGVNLTQGDKNY